MEKLLITLLPYYQTIYENRKVSFAEEYENFIKFYKKTARLN